MHSGAVGKIQIDRNLLICPKMEFRASSQPLTVITLNLRIFPGPKATPDLPRDFPVVSVYADLVFDGRRNTGNLAEARRRIQRRPRP